MSEDLHRACYTQAEVDVLVSKFGRAMRLLELMLGPRDPVIEAEARRFLETLGFRQPALVREQQPTTPETYPNSWRVQIGGRRPRLRRGWFLVWIGAPGELHGSLPLQGLDVVEYLGTKREIWGRRPVKRH